MNQLTAWFKSLGWVVLVGAVGAGIMFVLNARRAGFLEAEVAHDESKIKKLNKDTISDVKEAAKLQDRIATKKIQARVVRKKSEATLERIGQDETTADIAKRFNGKRVRSREDTAAKLRGGGSGKRRSKRSSSPT